MAAQHVRVLSTDQVVENDMACGALEEAGIPHYSQAGIAGGGQFPSSVTVLPLHGARYEVIVPQQWAGRARRIIAELPLGPTAET